MKKCNKCKIEKELSEFTSKARKCIKCTKEYDHQPLRKLKRTFTDMKRRCYDINHPAYMSYGGRGIKICDEWLNNEDTFINWAIINGWQENLSIDKIDNDKGYSASNCRWATKSQQRINTRIPRNNTSGYKCIGNTKWGTFTVVISNVYIGSRKTIEEAIELRNANLAEGDPRMAQ